VVEMPFGNAFDSLEQLKSINFETVFVTAYSQYALKSLNYSASYYILKPIDIDELESSIIKVRENIEMKSEDDFALQTKVLLENFKCSQNKDKKVVLPVLDGF
jgi:two-component system LytT family response regulator